VRKREAQICSRLQFTKVNRIGREHEKQRVLIFEKGVLSICGCKT